jgi:CRP-like cAMP-binding protein
MKKILLIEDNEDVRENTAEMLELSNYEVITAENGKIGVALAKEHMPDLIICDIMMPELDGYGVLYLLSKDEKTSAIPFIFLSAKAEKSDVRKGMNLGADDYLTKPFEELELLSAVESRLQRSDQLKSNNFSNDIEGINNFLKNAENANTLLKLSDERKKKNLKKKQILFYEGDTASFVYFINEGSIRTFKTNDDGKEFGTGLYNKGEFLGVSSVLKGNEYLKTAEATIDGEVLCISKEDFLSVLFKDREISAQFIKLMANNIAEKEQMLMQMAYDSVRQRVAETLVRLSGKLNPENKVPFEMVVPRTDLASMVGTSTETVIRTLSDFKEEKLVDLKGSKITLLNLESLKNLRF